MTLLRESKFVFRTIVSGGYPVPGLPRYQACVGTTRSSLEQKSQNNSGSNVQGFILSGKMRPTVGTFEAGRVTPRSFSEPRLFPSLGFAILGARLLSSSFLRGPTWLPQPQPSHVPSQQERCKGRAEHVRSVVSEPCVSVARAGP